MLRKLAVVALAFAAVQLPAVPAHAQFGLSCGMSSFTDPTAEGDVQTGEISGGPMSPSADETGANISIRCTIQVGVQGATHAGADAYSAEGPTSAGVAVLPAHQLTYVAPAGVPVYVCTAAEVNGQVRYYNETEDDATRGWSTSSSAACSLAISQGVGPGPIGGELDGIICPVLVAVLGGDGDIDGVWDCPPYGTLAADSSDDAGPEEGEEYQTYTEDPHMIGCVDTNDGVICF